MDEVVVKFFLIENNEDYLNSQLKINNEDFVIQAIQSQMGKDLRVFVIGKQIIAAVLRVNNNDFRANFKLGGSAFLYHLTIYEVVMIIKIINHFDFGHVGLDFLIDK